MADWLHPVDTIQGGMFRVHRLHFSPRFRISTFNDDSLPYRHPLNYILDLHGLLHKPPLCQYK
jgi:hypothetical protein